MTKISALHIKYQNNHARYIYSCTIYRIARRLDIRDDLWRLDRES